MSKDLDLFLIRHAQSYQNSGEEYPPGFHEDDAPLTDYGKAQANALALFFDEKIDRFYSSTLIRTAQTVYPLAMKNNKTIVMLPELREADSLVCGKSEDEIKKLVPCVKVYEGKESPVGFPVYLREETQEELRNRAESVVKYILNECNDGEKAVIASHAAYFGYLLREILNIELPEKFCWQINNCAVTHIRLRKDDIPIVVTANNTGHLLNLKKAEAMK